MVGGLLAYLAWNIWGTGKNNIDAVEVGIAASFVLFCLVSALTCGDVKKDMGDSLAHKT